MITEPQKNLQQQSQQHLDIPRILAVDYLQAVPKEDDKVTSVPPLSPPPVWGIEM